MIRSILGGIPSRALGSARWYALAGVALWLAGCSSEETHNAEPPAAGGRHQYAGSDGAASGGGGSSEGGVAEGPFVLRIVTTGLEAPWEITWGPDGFLWLTERVGKRVIRVDPATGTRTNALVLSDAYQSGGQDGLLGMALHPGLLKDSGNDYVYLAYTYDADPGEALDRHAKIVRYTYNKTSQELGSPVTIIEGLHASTDHNSGRLAYGPDEKLYYTIGDQGSNQFNNKCKTVRAQELPTQAEVQAHDWTKYQGKILRLNLDGSVPADNPVLLGVQSHVLSYGHRNAQGLAFGPNGKLYASEQGPKTDDELNFIQPGKNYGWPHVVGYQDDKGYVYGNWSASSPESCSELSFSDYVFPPSVPQQLESAWTHPDFIPPITTFYTVDNGFNFMDPACGDNAFICWPTIAPSSLDIYVSGQDGFAGWGTSLLLTSLKTGSVFRVRLGADGTAVEGTSPQLFKTINRYRDLTIAPDKRTFYVITDSVGSTSGPTQGSTQELQHRGAILEFRNTPPM